MNNQLTSGTAGLASENADPDIQGAVLFVDDEENILTSLKRLMRKQPLKCFFASSAEEGLAILNEEKVDVIISDMRMPNMDGADFLTKCKARWPKTMRVLLTGHADISATITALNHGGIYRYLSKPWDEQELLETIEQGLRVGRLERDKLSLLLLTKQQNEKLLKFNEELERRVVARTEEIKQTSDMLELVYQQLQDSYTTFIKLFSSVIASRHHLNKSKSNLVAELARKLATTLNLPTDETKSVYHAGLLMDLGKLNLSDEILQLPEEKISTEHKAMFERHPLHAEMTLSSIPELEPVARLVRSHMELIDGTGFPDRLKGNAIPRGARILRIARDFVGLQTGLLKDISLDANEAFKLIKLNAGKKYDPYVIKILETLSEEFSLGEEFAQEVKIDAMQLSAGMIVSRDIYNSMGILMIAKGFKLNQNIIDKLASINAMNEVSLKIFVYKEGKEE
jgi:response regulator RpfG family c-di-GMP phosphodiesterase